MAGGTLAIEGTIRVLVVEDEEFDIRRLRSTLKPFEGQIRIGAVVSSGDAALKILEERGRQFDVVVMDLQIAGGVMGEALIRAIKQLMPSIQIIVMTKMTINITDFDFANRLLRAGAFWYCTKYPSDIEDYIYQPTDFILSLVNAYQRRLLEREDSRSKRKLLKNVEEKLAQTRILGISEPVRNLRAQVRQLSVSDATVLIVGASGTGKDIVANQIHYESRRRLENFVVINCGSIPDDLIESELFGYEKGAFTGAQDGKLGFFEVANRGTLFLDEISELPLPAQVKLLRVIQEGEIEKIGRTEQIKVDVRILAATSKILQKEVAAGRFREDLFYRLNVVPLYVPSLKDRPEDIPVLWEHFMRQMSLDMQKEIPETQEAAYEVLAKYAWPGNVRELKNVVQRLLLRNENPIVPEIVREELHLNQFSGSVARSDAVFFREGGDGSSLRDMEDQFRKKYFQYVRNNSSSDADAARKLGLAPPNYYRMCRQLGLKSK